MGKTRKVAKAVPVWHLKCSDTTSQSKCHLLTSSFVCSSDASAASGHSDCPTVISVDSNRSWSGIHSSTGTGISTERSSVFSWGYDVSHGSRMLSWKALALKKKVSQKKQNTKWIHFVDRLGYADAKSVSNLFHALLLVYFPPELFGGCQLSQSCRKKNYQKNIKAGQIYFLFQLFRVSCFCM